MTRDNWGGFSTNAFVLMFHSVQFCSGTSNSWSRISRTRVPFANAQPSQKNKFRNLNRDTHVFISVSGLNRIVRHTNCFDTFYFSARSVIQRILLNVCLKPSVDLVLISSRGLSNLLSLPSASMQPRDCMN